MIGGRGEERRENRREGKVVRGRRGYGERGGRDMGREEGGGGGRGEEREVEEGEGGQREGEGEGGMRERRGRRERG